MTEWRLIVTEPAAGAWNMAVDEALMESVRAGAPPALRLYRWSPPCLSLGRNQPAAGVYDPERLRSIGVDVVRRPTGGRAVLHDDELTYAVVARDRTLGTVRQAYRAIHSVLASWLSSFGAEVVVAAGSGRAPVPSTEPCFARPVEGEVTARDRKLVGSAQVRVAGVLLQHGSIPLGRSAIVRELASAGLDVGSPADLHSELGIRISLDRLVAELVRAWTAAIAPCAKQPLTTREAARAAILESRYHDPGWMWRL